MVDLQKKLEILLVEDEEKDVFFIEHSLHEAFINFNIEKVQTLKKALSSAKKKKFDIVLLDLNLPDSTGLDTINMLSPFLTDTPMVVLTGLEDKKILIDAASSGVEDYLLKNSIRSDILSKTIYYSIERKKNELELLKYKDRLEDIVSERTADLKTANKRLMENLSYTEKLVDFGKKINNSLKMENIVKTVNELLKEILYMDHCSIFLYNELKNVLSLLTHNHNKWEKKEKTDFNKHGIMRDCIESKKAIILKKFSESPYAAGIKEKKAKYKNDASICIPLIAEKRIVGVMNLSNIREDFLNDENIAKINTIAQHLSLAMNNSILHEKVEHQSIIDDLTQLYNRRYLYSALENEIDREKRFHQGLSILMIDIDFFKKINDEYGHSSGDTVLKSVSAVIKSKIRKIDTACRYGGEEFIVILPFTLEIGAKVVAERIRKSLENNKLPLSNDREVKITVSIGIAKYNKNENLDVLINRSDTAMYDAKKKGRNQLVYID